MYLGTQEGDGHVGLGSVCALGNCLTFFPNMETCYSDFDTLQKGPLLRSPQRKLIVSSLCLTTSLFIVLVVLPGITAMLCPPPCIYPWLRKLLEHMASLFPQRVTSAP